MKYYEIYYSYPNEYGIQKELVAYYYTTGDPNLFEMEEIAKKAVKVKNGKIEITSYVEIDQDSYFAKIENSI